MSVNGLQQQYIPPTLDGLNVIDADQIYIDGELVDLDNLVPYTGATKILDMGSLPVRSSAVPTTGNDLINFTELVNAITNQDTTNSTTYLNKITSTAQTVAAPITFNQFTSQQSVIFKNTAGNSFQVQANEDDDLELLSLANAPNKVVIDKTGKIYSSALGISKALVSDADGKIVSSGVDASKIDYLDNVSSDIQTQLNARLLKAGDTMTGALDMGSNKVTTTYTPVDNVDLISKGYADSTYVSSGVLANYLPLTGGTLTGNLSSNTGTLVNFGEALKTVATDKGYTAASFTISSAEVPAGVQTGTLSGTYRLTALSGYAVMAMAIADLNATYQQNEYYTFTFTGIAGSVPLTLTVYQNSTPRLAVNITTSPQTITRTFTTGTGSGKIYFNFQALSANPYVDWTGFTMTRTDTQVNGFLSANGTVGIGTTSADTLLNVWGKGKFYDGNLSAPVVGVNGGAGTRLILWPGTVSAYPFALGIDASTLWYGVPAGSNHRWFDGGTERMNLSSFLDVKGGIRSYANGVGGPAFIYAENANAGDAYAVIYLRNNNSSQGCYWFMNSTTRSADGGANTATLRNDAGRLRLQGAQAYGIQVYNNGAVGVEGASPYAITNNFMGRGSLTIGSVDQNFGGGTGGWTSTTAGLLFECLTHTEIAVHDAGQRVASLMYYLGDGTNRIYIGRDMGYGTTGTTFRGPVDVEAGDGSHTYYGPNATWGAYLLVGARTNAITANRAQVISTNGNLHLDGGIGKEMYYGYYAWNGGGQNSHRFYGNSYFQGGVYTSDWFRLQNNNNGLYWENLGRGISSPEGGGNTYGTITTYGSGRSGWVGYGLQDRFVFMGGGGTGGIHDNIYSWLILWYGSSTRDVLLGGGSTMCSQGWDLFVVWRTGNSYDWSNGYFYFNKGGGYGYTSDSRLKENIKPIQTNESITFLKHLQPSSFCMKEARPVEVEKADGTKETVHPQCCTCEQDGFIADNVWEAVVASGASKTVLNNWSGWLEEMKKPEEERQLTKDNILGVNDRPILSHTVNAVKALIERVEQSEAKITILEAREKVWEADAKQKEEEFAAYKEMTDRRLEQIVGLLKGLLDEKAAPQAAPPALKRTKTVKP